MTSEELERAVERVENEVFTCERGGLIRAPVVTLADLRLILSERAELLASVERMRGGLESIAAYYPPGHRVEELAHAALTTGEEK